MEKLVKEIEDVCQQNDIKLVLSNSDFVTINNVNCSGFFDAKNKTLELIKVRYFSQNLIETRV